MRKTKDNIVRKIASSEKFKTGSVRGHEHGDVEKEYNTLYRRTKMKGEAMIKEE